jgi:pimeloyl-ACP methyl ester carboxylesterase
VSAGRDAADLRGWRLGRPGDAGSEGRRADPGQRSGRAAVARRRAVGELLTGPQRAFLATLRTVVDSAGQTINATGMLPVMAEIPTMTVWGGRDRLIPVQHARHPHRAIPSSRLEIDLPQGGPLPAPG